jgi:hypothetical protein
MGISYKKCPPGVICIENITMSIIIVICFIVIYLVYISIKPRKVIHNKTERIIVQERDEPSISVENVLGQYNRPNYPYNNMPGDVFLNPYMPPLKDERYMVPYGRMPINISTSIGAVDTNYRQVGILTSLTSSGKMIPLMGRPLFVNRDKWQYYTMSDQNNSIKLPIVKNGRSCTNEYGCDKLYDGDTIYVEGYNEAFKVTVYENDTIRYIPYL